MEIKTYRQFFCVLQDKKWNPLKFEMHFQEQLQIVTMIQGDPFQWAALDINKLNTKSWQKWGDDFHRRS